jgi:pyruvate-formate lyase-activating enzyme
MNKIKKFEIRLTNKCNAECGHCSTSSNNKYNQSISLNKLKVFFNNYLMIFNSPKVLQISGGEPMLFQKEVLKIAEYFLSHNIKSSLATNAFWTRDLEKTQKIVQKLKDSGISHFWISADYFHLQYVPIENIKNIVKALQNENVPFFVNFDYINPINKVLGNIGIPGVRHQIEEDEITNRIHTDIGKLLKDGQHGWCRVIDIGRGKSIVNSIKTGIDEAKKILSDNIAAINNPAQLEITVEGDVLHCQKKIGNIGNAAEVFKVLEN